MSTDVSNSDLLLGIGTDALISPMKLQMKERESQAVAAGGYHKYFLYKSLGRIN